MVFASHHIIGISCLCNSLMIWRPTSWDVFNPNRFCGYDSWNSQESKRKSVWLYFCLICTALPLSSHSGSHNPPSPTNLLPDLPIKSLMPHFMPPRVRTYLVLQHTCTCRLQWKPFSEMKLCRARIYFSFSVFYSCCFCICFKKHWGQIWILSQLLIFSSQMHWAVISLQF